MTSRSWPSIFFLAAAIGFAPEAAWAQRVVGTLTSPAGEPLVGAVVTLLDADGTERAQVLTSPAGRFLLRVPEPGEYRVRAEMIGFETRTGPPLRVAAGETVVHHLVAAVEPVRLEGIVAEGESRCLRDPGEGAQVMRLWEEARKALTAASLTEREGLLSYRLSLQERELAADGRVTDMERRTREIFNRVPLASAEPEALATSGFVWSDEEGGMVFHAPDAPLLLSDAFLDHHCFRVAEGRGDRHDQVGLAFEPVPERRLPEIAGTFWLDRESAELREIEFRWVNLPWPGVEADARGSVRLERAPTGAWFVRSAHLRMPRTLQRLRGGEFRAVAFREKAFEVGEVTDVRGEAVFEAPAGGIRGTVIDEEADEPLAGVEVSLAGTEHRATTDSLGRFRFPEVRPGLHAVVVSVAGPDGPLPAPPAAPVDVRDGEVAELEARVLLPRRISAEVRVVAFIEDRGTGEPLAGASVSLDGGEPRVSDEQGRVRWDGVAPGKHEVEVSHLAVGTRRDSLEVVGERTEVFRVLVLPDAVELEPLEVTVDREEVGGGRMAGFYQRMETLAGGHFITREQLERREAQPLMTTLQSVVPGLTQVCGKGGQGSTTYCTLRSRRRMPSLDPAQRSCELVYYLDGVRFDMLPGTNLNNILRGWDVEAVEFYPGPAGLPAQFNSPDARCGVLVLWTRRPGPDVAGPGS